MSEMRRTPLHAFHVRHGARMVPFAGWEMPVQYKGILEEHSAVRRAAGLFDVSHMGEVRVHGPQARAFLDSVFTNEVARAVPGASVYGLFCQADGTVVDDLIIYGLGVDDYFLCINAGNNDKDIAWLREHHRAGGWDCALEPQSEQWAQLALQGPRALEILAPLADFAPDAIARFGCRRGRVAGVEAIVARTGYTGEDGVEIYTAPGAIEAVAEAILQAGAPLGLQLAGLGCRDSLRIEAGLPLYGHELGGEITPLQAGLGWAVKLQKAGGFIGRDALAAEKAAGVARKVVYYTLDNRRIAREGTPVLCGGQPVGRVLSGSLSPISGLAIGSALVDSAALAGGQALSVDLRGTVCQLTPRARKPIEAQKQ